MGIARGAVGLLLHETQRRPFSGRLATIGRQTVAVNRQGLVEQFRKFDLQPATNIEQGGKALDDQELFKSMGFAVVHSMDYSDYEGATHLINLNSSDVPADLREQYDVVLDSGTLEHVFHVPNAMRQIAGLAKPGGRIIFLAPSSNHFEHSFYMFSPTFFFDWFMANKFRVETLYVVRYDRDLEKVWDVYGWRPNEWRDVQIGGLDAKPYAIFVVATKTAESTDNAIPQQGYYANDVAHYSGSRTASASAGHGSGYAVLREAPLTPTAVDTPTALQQQLRTAVAWSRWLVGGVLRRTGRMIRRLSPPAPAIIPAAPAQYDDPPGRRLIGRF